MGIESWAAGCEASMQPPTPYAKNPPEKNYDKNSRIYHLIAVIQQMVSN